MEKEVLGGQLRKLLFNHLSGWIHLMSRDYWQTLRKRWSLSLRNPTRLAYFGSVKKVILCNCYLNI